MALSPDEETALAIERGWRPSPMDGCAECHRPHPDGICPAKD